MFQKTPTSSLMAHERRQLHHILRHSGPADGNSFSRFAQAELLISQDHQDPAPVPEYETFLDAE